MLQNQLSKPQSKFQSNKRHNVAPMSPTFFPYEPALATETTVLVTGIGGFVGSHIADIISFPEVITSEALLGILPKLGGLLRYLRRSMVQTGFNFVLCPTLSRLMPLLWF